MKKNILYIILLSGLISCGKVIQYSTDYSSIVFINASPSSSTAAVPSTFNVYVDTMIQTSTAIAFKSTSGYLSVLPGTRNVEFRNIVNFITYKFFSNPAMSFVTNSASTVFAYDTLSPSNLFLKTLRLNDDLTLPAAGSIKVRFIPLAVNAPSMDVTFLRTSITPNDSVTITNQTYVGATPTPTAIQALSTFIQIPLGAYTIKLKTSGTQTVLTSTTASLSTLTNVGNTVGINTFYSTGTAQGAALSIGVFRNYP